MDNLNNTSVTFKLLKKLTTWTGIANSDSMSPLINQGDKIVFIKLQLSLINILDIIAFKKEKKIIVHRVIAKYKKSARHFFITKGDNLHKIDKPIFQDVILGKAIKIKNRFKEIPLTDRSHTIFYYFQNYPPFIRVFLRKIIYSNKLRRFIRFIKKIYGK